MECNTRCRIILNYIEKISTPVKNDQSLVENSLETVKNKNIKDITDGLGVREPARTKYEKKVKITRKEMRRQHWYS